jgi:hypothetical protein
MLGLTKGGDEAMLHHALQQAGLVIARTHAFGIRGCRSRRTDSVRVDTTLFSQH